MWFPRAVLPFTTAILAIHSSSTIITTVNAQAVENEGEVTDADEKHSAALIAWLKSQKGYFNPKLQMRRSDPSDPNSRFGMYAQESIAANTMMLRIPADMILDSAPDDEEIQNEPEGDQMECGTVRNLSKQLKLGDESFYAPYVNYLLATQPPGQLPSAWSEGGKALFTYILSGTNVGDEVEGGYALPPDTPVEWRDVWYNDCNPNGEEDDMDEYAAHLIIQRSWDDLLIPVFDMMSHRNDPYLNTKSNEVHVAKDKGEPVIVRARRKIEAGEEIYTTYNMCEDCGNRVTDYGTPEILRDYGFVEQMPQSWNFMNQEVSFRIDDVMDQDGKPTGGHTITEWIHEEPDEDDMEIMREILEQLEETLDDTLADYIEDGDVPKHEWDMITQYFTSMAYALSVAIDFFDDADDSCIQDGTCKIQSLSRYMDLEKRELECWDDVGNEWPTCSEDNIDAVFDEDIYEELEFIESPYQKMTFTMNKETRDTCFDLDRTLQICDSYRPQYHEMSVHNAVRYLSTFERVLWVGGGDAMLLHEFVKYPSATKIVGLELDQRVTRASFKHHGTQPHFDQDRVEWWFGDATKSLLMLPKEYFGSFDLVIVDLSETIMSEKVTEEIDVLDALTLLLKSDGIMLKNEFYFGKFKTMFSHSVMVHWYDNPVICSQAMVMGSWNVDFMRPTLKDDGVDTLYLEPLENIDDPFGLYHDYTRNFTSSHLCQNMQLSDDKEPANQISSPGIILIVEVEDATVDLENSEALEGLLTSALEKEGFTVVSTDATQSDDHLTVTIILNQGYVVARTAPKDKYCGFDIHLWSNLDKHESAEQALVTAVGSKRASLSSYRVIAGGMFGTQSWEADEKSRGPQYSELCENNVQVNEEDLKPPRQIGNVDQLFVNTVMEEGVSLVRDKNLRVLMLIGSEGKDSLSRSALESIESIGSIDTIYCPSMQNFNEFDEGALRAASSCEQHLTSSLVSLADEGEIDILVIDSDADRFTASILLRTFSGARNKRFARSFFSDVALILSPLVDEKDNWRRNFMQLFKTDVFYLDPACFIEVVFSDQEDGAMKLLLANKAQAHFIQHLNSTLSAYEEKSGLESSIELIDGAEFVTNKDFNPKKFSPDDFNQEPSLLQWKSQKPIAHQIIFQMETENKVRSLSCMIVRESLENAIKKSGLSDQETTEDSIKEYTNIGGDGCVLMKDWSGGSIVVLWDGRVHVDVNLVTYEQDLKKSNIFDESFRENTTLSTILRDEQPRGSGRIVSYFNDLIDGVEPHWA